MKTAGTTTKLSDYYERWKQLTPKKNLTGAAALAAVKQNWYALQYVAAQTEAVCLAAVKRDWLALRHVAERMFETGGN